MQLCTCTCYGDYSPILRRTCRSANLPETKWKPLHICLTLDGVAMFPNENVMYSQASSLFISQRMSSAALVSYCMRERVKKSCFLALRDAKPQRIGNGVVISGLRERDRIDLVVLGRQAFSSTARHISQLSEEVTHESST
jgi:hypothetical protein